MKTRLNARIPKGRPQLYFFEVLLGVLFFFIFTPAFGAAAATMQDQYPDFARGFLKSARLDSLPEDLLLQTDGVSITLSDLTNIIKDQEPKIRGQMERNLIFVLEQEAVRRILLREAQNTGITVSGGDDNQAIQALLELHTKDVAIPEDEVRAFYESNKEMVGTASFEQVAVVIRQYLLQDKKQRAAAAYIDSLGSKAGLSINEKWVKSQKRLALDNPVDKARRSGKPTMVEFGATGCVPCDMMQPILDKLRRDYPQKMNVVFVHVGEEQILAARYGIQSIPVQVFFDDRGREVFRHVGFLGQPEVDKQIAAMGIQK